MIPSEVHSTGLNQVVTATESKSVSLGLGSKPTGDIFCGVGDLLLSFSPLWNLQQQVSVGSRLDRAQAAREPRPNLYSGRLRLYLSRTDYDTPQDYLLRARTPATAP
jgi:hypothetical protein